MYVAMINSIIYVGYMCGVCSKRYPGGGTWFGCDKCNSWYHCVWGGGFIMTPKLLKVIGTARIVNDKAFHLIYALLHNHVVVLLSLTFFMISHIHVLYV